MMSNNHMGAYNSHISPAPASSAAAVSFPLCLRPRPRPFSVCPSLSSPISLCTHLLPLATARGVAFRNSAHATKGEREGGGGTSSDPLVSSMTLWQGIYWV